MIPYTYRCVECFHEQDILFEMGKQPRRMRCNVCRAIARRVYNPAGVHWHCRGATKGRADPFRHKDGSALEKSVRDGDPTKELDVER